MNKIKKHDIVIIRSGNDKKRQGKVLRIFPKKRCALIESIAMLKHYTKGNPQEGTTGGIIEKESTIPLSKLSVYNSTTQKIDKIIIQKVEKKNYRYFRSNHERIHENTP